MDIRGRIGETAEFPGQRHSHESDFYDRIRTWLGEQEPATDSLAERVEAAKRLENQASEMRPQVELVHLKGS